jgi:hypothetical protein
MASRSARPHAPSTRFPKKGLPADERAALLAHFERLREEHRDRDAAIEALSEARQADQLTPDIIA